MVPSVNVDISQTEKLLRLLDTVVIKLEGGTDEDLKVLDEKPVEIKPMDSVFSKINNVSAPVRSSSAPEEPNKKPETDDGDNVDDDGSEQQNGAPIVGNKNNPFSRKPDIPVVDLDWISKIKGTNANTSKSKSKQNNDDEENWDDDGDDDVVPVTDDAAKVSPQQRKSGNPFARKPEDEWKPTNKVKPMPAKTNNADEENWDDEDIYADQRNKAAPTEVINSEQNDAPKSPEPETKPDGNDNDDDDDDDASDDDEQKSKRKRNHSESSSSSSSSSDSDDEDEKTDDTKNESKENDDVPTTTIVTTATDEPIEPEMEISENKPSADDEINDEDVKMKDAPASPVPSTTEEKTDDPEKEKQIEEEPKKKDEEEAVEKKPVIEEDKDVETIDLDKENDPKDEEPGLRAMHKTSSIFLRNLAPTITKSEVEGMCKRYNGFLRVAIADPLVERRWFRRGWVTFQRDVNIKEICWNLNNIRLRDCELGAIVNRDLSRRIRPINGITAHKTIVRSDIKLCAKITFNLDLKSGLWQSDDDSKPENGTATFGLISKNPVLQNITDYLIEEASAEEDELLGLSGSDNKDAEGEPLERDPILISVLDKLILYLRIVHSVDFYNHCEYPYEDEMPNRCGIIHARGPVPQNRITHNEIQDYIRNFEGKMSSFLTKTQSLEEQELKKLGCKDTDAEIEKFIQANTQELAKDKWLCPLSGKKFKGPDFIRKHIFNKHGEKVDEVKKEVEYFNNYLKDPKRPQLPEHPGNIRKPAAEMAQMGG